MVSVQAIKLEAMLRAAPKAVDMDLTHQRAAGERAEDLTSEPVGVTYEPAPQVGGLWAIPQNASPRTAIMYLYGGGYVVSLPASLLSIRRLASALGTRMQHIIPIYCAVLKADAAAMISQWIYERVT